MSKLSENKNKKVKLYLVELEPKRHQPSNTTNVNIDA